MVNKRKVRLMSRTAMYEKHEGNQDLPKAAFYKSDYVAVKMWCTAIAVTIAYILILCLVVACNFEQTDVQRLMETETLLTVML